MKKALTAIAALVLVSSAAVACGAGVLIRSDFLGSAWACTYQLNDGTQYRMIIPASQSCPYCL